MHLIYEMHVYTMATRSYAEAIANIIDPDKRFLVTESYLVTKAEIFTRNR